MEIEGNRSEEYKKETNKTKKYTSFNQIVNMLYIEEMSKLVEEKETQTEKIKIETQIIYDKYNNNIRVEFKIGNQRMYKLKEIPEFYERMKEQKKHKYGSKLEFVHKKENFREEDQQLLEFIIKHGEMIKYVNLDTIAGYTYYGKVMSGSYIVLSETGLDEIYDILKNRKIVFQKDFDSIEEKVEIKEEDPDIHFILQKKEEEYEMKLNKEIDVTRDIEILSGKKYKYILYNKILYRCSKKYEKTVINLLEMYKKNYFTEILISKEQLPELFSIVLPQIGEGVELKGIQEEIEKYRPKKLGVKVYLDFDPNDYIIAEIKFCYGDEEFNLLDDKINIESARDIISEHKIINMIRKTGFMYYKGKKCLVLVSDDKIFNFLSNEINEYMQKFEVMATDRFKKRQIKQPKIGNIGIRIENNLLKIDLEKLNIDINELEEIMEKYQLRKKYHKLKDGSFINLEEETEDLEFIDQLMTGMNIKIKEIEKGTIRLPVNRSLYLEQLLKPLKNTQISKNEEFKKIINKINKETDEEMEIPKNLENILRYYQKKGYKWLKSIDNYRLGGILADDMGLGKTIQMLSIIAGYVEETESNKRASIVICPSSLTLNWQNEAQKFTNKLKILVIKGTSTERKKQIKEIDNYDIVITSYDLLKRDIEEYRQKNYQFKYSIADEAQYLKNSNTQNAKTVKEINADTRYALTGTPIENSLGELWSMFDYIMPGYLFDYKKFKTLYETPIVKENDERSLRKLKMLIEPFILRRTKKEVLTELPEKTITVLNNQMKKEQEEIYINYLAQAKQEVAEIIKIKGLGKSQMHILAVLTRLRQICCHPSLFIKDYKEGSSKLEQCMEVIQGATDSEHKILLFSGYTAMFELIEKELQEKGIKYYKLTGTTKVDERIRMVDEFNANPEIKVFLISLKAGGTGLNLTGADVVIHYDPWWNISAENQATDRAYRIGQKNNVQVYKLITKNTIEEKIYELQQKKAELIDNILSTKTSFLSQMSKEEIMKLFE